ncbi:MAG: elongation factor EF-2 [Thaumarchaeota archaeon]|nr:MAG: elongation factor EF-2 [Nitrososphaerota archaeon]
MPRFKSTTEALKIVSKKDQIRNLGIIAHVDHGKTTTSDSLLAASGMLSPSVAGQALALDYMELEQQRQMTIKAANVTLYYESKGTPYVINLIDTPGHIDFTGKVTERVRPVLYINKVDRLIKEIRLGPDKLQAWLTNIVTDFNRLIDLYAEPEYKKIWKVSVADMSVAFGASKDRWGFNIETARAAGMSFKDIYDAYMGEGPEKLSKKLLLNEALLSMVIRHHPSPQVAQSYRIPKIWHGDLTSPVGKALLTCDENGPTVMMVTAIVVDPAAGLVATGRLFSGYIRDGDEVYLIGAKRQGRVQSVQMFMGIQREIVGALPAGNIPAILGLDARSGETLATIKDVAPFESIHYVSEPVVTIAVEPKHPRDLPKLVEGMRRLNIEDPNLIVTINEETGETLMAGMGVLHLEIATTMLQQQGLEIVQSQPIINYRETVRAAAGPVMSRSPNRHNKVFMEIMPLSPDIVELIRNGTISETADKKSIQKTLREHGWDSDEARSVVAVDERGNMMTETTKGVQYLQESMASIRSGFEDIMKNGPLAYEFCRGIKCTLTNYVPHEDPAHRTYAQLMPASRRAILGAMLTANPTLLEPVLGIEVKGPTELIGAVTGVISGKRGKLVNIEQKEVLTVVEGELPAAETFDLSEVMRGATAGKAVWNTHFKLWQAVPTNMLYPLVTEIRKRKGLSPEPPNPAEFIDKE